MKIVIAAGGTGGHVFPSLAVAEKLKKLSPECQITFIGTKNRFEAKAVPEAGFDIEFLSAVKLKGISFKSKISSLFRLPLVILEAIKLLKKIEPDSVLGLGGYVSGPTLLAAWILRIPTAICEQNTVPGLTNRILGKFSKIVFGTFNYSRQYFKPNKFIWSGNPLRANFEKNAWKFDKNTKTLNILVLGGSQGAKAINQVMPQTVELLEKQNLDFKITHQCGEKHYENLKEQYTKLNLGLDSKINLTPFISDIYNTYLEADIVISRAGATSISEICALGVPSVLIPFPEATDNHQTINAQILSRSHAAFLLPQLELTPLRLGNELATLIQNDDRRLLLSNNLKRLRVLNAAELVAKAALNRFKTT